MQLEHIVVATDESEAGRSAVRMGLDLARRAGAELTFMTVVPAEPVPAAARLEQWLGAELAAAPPETPVGTEVTFGIPSIEICRFAEERRADLLVLGRKPRSQATRLLLGDTADAVARRSLVPSLYVPPGAGPVRRILAALDGTERGLVVFRAACAFAATIGASLRLVTVEPARENEPDHLAADLPTARTLRLVERVEALATAEDRRCLRRETGDGDRTRDLVLVRRGDPVEQILDAADWTDADLLAVGYRRGGPPGVVEGGSVARRLAHLAPCALLAIPL